MAAQDLDVAVVGHFSNDCLKLPSRAEPYAVMGGAVAYVSLTARQLGGSVSVISRVGSDFPDAYLQQLATEGVDTSAIRKVQNEQTTSFELLYNKDLSSRVLRLRRQGSPIVATDLPPALHAKVIHIAPIDGEISYELIKNLRTRCRYLSIDPQGMTRRFDLFGNVTSSAEMDKQLLRLIDIYKSSFDEVKVLTGCSDLEGAICAVHNLGPKIVIVTMGSEGSVISTGGIVCSVPVYSSRAVVDPTGAGDVFIGAFLTEYVRGSQDLFWCACAGSAAASIAIEGVGATFFGEKEEIYRRAQSIYCK